MELDIFQVDAFASRPFEGNPAAVCPLDKWLPDELMQSIAMENNLSETAFFVPEDGGYSIRWFTPATEVDLCGHATLASAWVLYRQLGFDGGTIRFSSKSGPLEVSQDGDLLVLDFPAQPPEHCATPPGLSEALGAEPTECLQRIDLMAVFDEPGTIHGLSPDTTQLVDLGVRGVIVTSPDADYDFISRFFAPACGVPEDPVTGSAHTKLAPYWAARLGKQKLRARQVSHRGGDVFCTLDGDRVLIAGRAVGFMQGSIQV